MWFYSLPKHDSLCHPARKLYQDYLGAVKYGNIFSIDVGPDYQGRIRDIDVETLKKVGEKSSALKFLGQFISTKTNSPTLNNTTKDAPNSVGEDHFTT